MKHALGLRQVRIRTQHNCDSALPTRCQPIVSSYNPAQFGRQQGLTQICSADEMLCISPPILANQVQEVAHQLQITTDKFDLITLWERPAAIVAELHHLHPDLYAVVDVDALWNK
ncbi:hypothetical protein DFH28DRAFT_1086213 [Melampsora americana]|nr:hypothetical protein DFH28DRAFT_1086213 [Melampsora americana]